MYNLFPRLSAFLIGTAITLIGLFAFIQDYNPDGKLFGIFEVNTFHTLVHLLTGIVALVMVFAWRGRYAAAYLLGLGLLYGVLTIFGFILQGDFFQLAYFNFQDNLLHSGIALVALLLCLVVAIQEPELFLNANRTYLAGSRT